MKEKIKSLSEEVLRIENIDTSESLFSYGLDSVMALILICKIEKEIGIELPMRFLFEHQNIDSMVEYINREKLV